MQYSELIQFTALESVIEIRKADQISRAKELVATYVISKEMADRLIHLVFPQLQFNQQCDNKALLIIGNYGTGKSHLMAVISSIAENVELVKQLNHSLVAETAKIVAGKFQVLRIEIGATSMSLRDIISLELSQFLATKGINFQFPDINQVTNNKIVFTEMMQQFVKHYPEQGLLLVVDELLDYLSTRSDQNLILDLSFLREIGEVCKEQRFRFIAGLQETIFNNPRFEFVANVLRRVKDRFEQLFITRQDIKFVVTERLLKKTAQQKLIIENYLNQFASSYSNMLERMDEFVTLFPVHPEYINIFANLTIIEKREILRTLANNTHRLKQQIIPKNYPGLLTYDSYWHSLRENPSFRTLPEVREVIECSQVLENRLQQNFARPRYLPMALRIIHALSVHRLTTYDIKAPIGVTAKNLVEHLCLYESELNDLAGERADNLLSLVEMVLQEILKTVNQQFISYNAENSEYYIDFSKHYDFDALIEKRAESLDGQLLNRYYYTILKQVMEVSDVPSSEYQNYSWFYDLEWFSHKVTRQGFLIFGLPNEETIELVKTTNYFLLYFLPIYQSVNLPNSSTENELFFRLIVKDAVFEQTIKLYSAASELAMMSSGPTKTLYESKVKVYLHQLIRWLQVHKITGFELTYQAKTQSLIAWLKTVKSYNIDTNLLIPDQTLLANFRDLIDLVANICLNSYFTKLFPEYPVFPILISRENLNQITQNTLRGLANLEQSSRQTDGILTALDLLHNGKLKVTHSKYAKIILDRMQIGQVLNREELMPNEYLLPYHLEAELVIILIVALVVSNEIILAMPEQSYDATQLDALATIPIAKLVEFKYLEFCKTFNLENIKALFALFSLTDDLAIALTQNKENALQKLKIQITAKLTQCIHIQQIVNAGLVFWERDIFGQKQTQSYQTGLAQLKIFLESLQIYTTPLQFKHFHHSKIEIDAHQICLNNLQQIANLQTILIDSNALIAYLVTAERNLPSKHNWVQKAQVTREAILSQLKQPYQNSLNYRVQQKLHDLKQQYIQAYFSLHQQMRLNQKESQSKQELLQNKCLFKLKKLANIDILPKQQLDDFENQVNQLVGCYHLNFRDLAERAVCPHCHYQPVKDEQSLSALMQLMQLKQQLLELEQQWLQILLSELTGVSQKLLKKSFQQQITYFLTQSALPTEITNDFVQAVQESLSNLEKVTIPFENLKTALLANGSPMTVAEIQSRFDQYLINLVAELDDKQVRIILE